MTSVEILLKSKEFKRFKELAIKKLYHGEHYEPKSFDFIMKKLVEEMLELWKAYFGSNLTNCKEELVDVSNTAMIGFLFLEGLK